MNRFTRFTALGLVLAATAAGAFVVSGAEAQSTKAAPAAEAKKLDIKPGTVYAKVDGQSITGKDVENFISKLPPQFQAQVAGQDLEPIVNQMVNDRLVAKAAAAQKLENDPKTQAMIEEAKEQVIRDRYVEKALESKITDAKVKAKFDEITKNTPAQDEIRASHILVKEEKTANDVLAKLKKGEKFDALAKEYSMDPTKTNGGDLGYFVRQAMVKEFGDAAYAMKKGEVSKTPVKSEFGYHIIKIVDRRPFKPEFEAVKDRVRGQLVNEELQNIVKDLRKDAKIELTLPKS